MASLFSCISDFASFSPKVQTSVNSEVETESKDYWGGGSQAKCGRPQRGGVSPDSTYTNKGREGVKNPENFADVLDGWPLIKFTSLPQNLRVQSQITTSLNRILDSTF